MSVSKKAALLLWFITFICTVSLIFISLQTPASTMYRLWTIKMANEKTTAVKNSSEAVANDYIAAYTSYKSKYEEYKDSTISDEKELAQTSKTIANEIAIKYNECTKTVWKNRLPAEIPRTMALIQ